MYFIRKSFVIVISTRLVFRFIIITVTKQRFKRPTSNCLYIRLFYLWCITNGSFCLLLWKPEIDSCTFRPIALLNCGDMFLPEIKTFWLKLSMENNTKQFSSYAEQWQFRISPCPQRCRPQYRNYAASMAECHRCGALALNRFRRWNSGVPRVVVD